MDGPRKHQKILVIAAHPDDEVLGCGGTIAKFAGESAAVHVTFLADGISSRLCGVESGGHELFARREAARVACEIMGTHPPVFSELPDNQLDTISLLQITKTIEGWIAEYLPDTVLTHHAGDVNIDHQRTHQAVVTACRPQQQHPVKTLLFFEVPSSTEWQTPGSAPLYAPNWFEDISATFECKLRALEAYAHELRDWPHPRSREGVEALARWRGATIGAPAAEAFMLGRYRG